MVSRIGSGSNTADSGMTASGGISWVLLALDVVGPEPCSLQPDAVQWLESYLPVLGSVALESCPVQLLLNRVQVQVSGNCNWK